MKAEKTGKKRIEVHPLFLLAGVGYAVFGKLPVFIVSTVVALLHEFAHASVAERLGYRLNRIVLMPYGAVIDGDLRGISLSDELKVALAGPLANLCTYLVFVATWWLFPSIYPYTELGAQASLCIGLINLLPAYPLDGGRVLACLLSEWVGERKSRKIVRTVSVVVASCLLCFGIGTFVVGSGNLSLGIFAVFVFVGALTKSNIGYEKISYFVQDALKRGLEEKRVGISEDFDLYRAFKFFESGKYTVFDVIAPTGESKGQITQNQLVSYLEKSDAQRKMSDVLQKNG